MVAPFDLDKVRDLATFAKAHVSSGDIDPAYPVMRFIQQELFKTEEERLWASMVYVAYYNLTSAVTVWLHPERLGDKLPIATERRGFRDHAKLWRHLEDLAWQAEAYGDFRSWLLAGGETYRAVFQQIGLAWGNGRWACYKLSEILHTVHGWPFMAAPDMALKESSGPRAGLALFTGPLADDELEPMAAKLDWMLEAHGIDLEPEQLETVLCDFHAMVDGRYYVGHDIDQQAEQAVEAEAAVRVLIQRARVASFHPAYLAELNGRPWAVDRERCGAYKATGAVLTRE